MYILLCKICILGRCPNVCFRLSSHLSSLSPVWYPWRCQASGWQSVNVCQMNGWVAGGRNPVSAGFLGSPLSSQSLYSGNRGSNLTTEPLVFCLPLNLSSHSHSQFSSFPFISFTHDDSRVFLLVLWELMVEPCTPPREDIKGFQLWARQALKVMFRTSRQRTDSHGHSEGLLSHSYKDVSFHP